MKQTKLKTKKAFDLRKRASSLRSSLKRRSGDSPSTAELTAWLKNQQPFVCYYFNTPVEPFDLHIDHKVPVTLGGSNNLENLCITSSKVNRAKGQFTEKEFKELVEFCHRNPDAKDYLITRLLVGGRVGRKSL